MDTTTVTMKATDGSEVQVNVPTTVPSNERADYLRTLYDNHVKHPGGHWKGVAVACVPAELADDVAEAMDFMGSLVDVRFDGGGWAWTCGAGENAITLNCEVGTVCLHSKGYWAHGF